MVKSDLRELPFEPLLVNNRASGVYRLLLAGEVVYVGQSDNVYRRLASHMLARSPASRGGPKARRNYFSPNDIRGRPIPFDSAEVYWCSVRDLNRIEMELIEQLRPRYNRRIVQVLPNAPEMEVSLTELGLGHLARPEQMRRRRVA